MDVSDVYIKDCLSSEHWWLLKGTVTIFLFATTIWIPDLALLWTRGFTVYRNLSNWMLFQFKVLIKLSKLHFLLFLLQIKVIIFSLCVVRSMLSQFKSKYTSIVSNILVGYWLTWWPLFFFFFFIIFGQKNSFNWLIYFV